MATFLRKNLVGAKSTWIHPTIPAKKLAGVQKNHGAHLAADEVVLAVYDDTVFGSATEGYFVTARRFGWKNTFGAPDYVEWHHFPEGLVSVNGSKLVIGQATIETLLPKNDADLWRWASVIRQLARCVAAEQEPGSAMAPAIEQLPASPWDTSQPSVGHILVDPLQQFVALASDRSIEIRHLQSGRSQMRFAVHKHDAICLTESRDGVVVGDRKNSVRIYSLASGSVAHKWENLSSWVKSVGCVPGRGLFFAVTDDGMLYHFVPGEPAPLFAGKISFDGTCLESAVLTPDGIRLLCSVRGGGVVAADVRTGGVYWARRVPGLWEGDVACSPRGDVMVLAADTERGRVLQFFASATGAIGPRFAFGELVGLTWPEMAGSYVKIQSSPRFSPDGRILAAQSPVGDLLWIDPYAGQPLWTPARAPGIAWVHALAFTPDGCRLIVAGGGEELSCFTMSPFSLTWNTRR